MAASRNVVLRCNHISLMKWLPGISTSKVLNGVSNMSSTFAQVNSQSSLKKRPPRSLVFIDSAVEDYESIAAGVLPGQQVVIVDRTKNGIEQITSELENYASTKRAIDSVHIISHGNSGSLQLGNTALDSDNIEQYKSQLKKWHNSLAPGADILLYACEVAGCLLLGLGN